MGLLQNLVKGLSGNRKEFKAKFKEAQEEAKIQRLIEERQKSSNQRELERYMKEQEEARIKEQLDKIRKKQTKELWKSENQILKKEKSILTDDRPILKEKNIFSNGNDIGFMRKGGMFLK